MTETNLAIATEPAAEPVSVLGGSQPSGPWTDTRVEMLKKLWAEGLTATRIAVELGGGITRNAVIGKIHRLGLQGKSKTFMTTGSRGIKAARGKSKNNFVAMRDRLENAKMQPPKTIIRGHGTQIEKVIDPVPMENATADDFLIPQAQRRTFRQLQSHQCRWPVGDPAAADFFYCGAAKINGYSYCGPHCDTAYRVTARMAARPAAIKKGRILADLV